MSSVHDAPATADELAEGVDTFDVVVVGAGAQGLCHLHVLREAGLSVRCYELGGGVGGTWYWNRYPGCAFDSPTESYSFSFAEKFQHEWDWKHYYSHQPEAEAYLNFIADRCDLRRDIQLNTRVEAATWIEDEQLWEIELDSGERVRASFLLPALGVFGAAFKAPFEGADRFQGEQHHTAQWPQEGVDFAGKRVAVIGTGASGVQLIPEVAKTCGQLTVFQRTATYCLPSRNGLVDPEVQQKWKDGYAEIHRRMQADGVLVSPDPRNGREVPREERLKLYEEAWQRRGFEKFMVLFHDLLFDEEILTEYSEWLQEKIRARIKDPALAEKLVPTNHLFQAKRVPLENNYYETYERENVSLVDLRETPIVSLTESGIRTTDRDYEFDVIIYATGFDSVTGAFAGIDIRGVDGRTLNEKWDETGLSTYLGLTVAGFPNFFICNVPALVSAAPPCAEWIAEWYRQCIFHMRAYGFTRVEPTQEAEDAWMEHHQELGNSMVFGNAEYTWYVGSNVPGKKRRILLYCNSGPGWRDKCYAVIEKGWEGLVMRAPEVGDRSDGSDREPQALGA